VIFFSLVFFFFALASLPVLLYGRVCFGEQQICDFIFWPFFKKIWGLCHLGALSHCLIRLMDGLALLVGY
jgi:hypothetical protein